MTGAIAQDRESCQFLFCLMTNPLLDWAARPESGQDTRERSIIGLRWQAVFGFSDCME
jgi:hypothetical protein